MISPRVAVIGAGVSGLASIKACLEENLDVICYERSSTIGGLWCYDENKRNVTSCMKCTVMNSSKVLTSFSDFPMPEDYPLYCPHELVLKYLQSYMEHFDLLKNIKYNQEIELMEQNENGTWKLTIRDADQNIKIETFDKVMVCSGFRNVLNMPDYDTSKFKGEILHAANYRTSEPYRNKNVLVVGVGPSAADCASDLVDVAKNVYLSNRSGAWLITRVVNGSQSLEGALLQRFTYAVLPYLPNWYDEYYFRKTLRSFVDPWLHYLPPKHGPAEHELLISDSLPSLLMTQKVKVCGEIDKFTDNGVIFKSGVHKEIDAVVFCTGYLIKFHFIKDKQLIQDIINPDNNQLGLHKYIFPPNNPHPGSISFIGILTTFGSMFPVIEHQARYAAKIFSGQTKLPSRIEMLEDIKKRQVIAMTLYKNGQMGRTSIYENWHAYLDDLSSLIGCKPNFVKIALTDPRLFYTLFFGLPSPSVYRLTGKHSWPKARETILAMNEQILPRDKQIPVND